MDDEGPPEEPATDGEEAVDDDVDTVPPAVYDSEDVDYMVADELLAVRVRGMPVGENTIAVGTAGPLLSRIHHALHAIALFMTGSEARGRRGPLPALPETGLLSLVGFTGEASVTFHFTLGPGEALRLGEPPATVRTLEAFTGLLELTAARDFDGLLEESRAIGFRAATDYYHLMRFLAEQHLDTVWRPAIEGDPTVKVPAIRAVEARKVLEEEDHPVARETSLSGWLYEANAKRRRFELQVRDEHGALAKHEGTYSEALRDKVAKAWDSEVVVRVVVTETFIRRQAEPTASSIELVDVLEIRGPAPDYDEDVF